MEPNTYNLNIELKSVLSIDLFSDFIHFDEILLDVERINIEGLTAFSIRSESIFRAGGGKFIIIFKGNFEKTVDVDGEEYKNFLLKESTSTTLKNKHYWFANIFIRELAIKFKALIEKAILYIKWKKKFSFGTGVFDNIIIDCDYKSEILSGALKNMLNIRIIEGVEIFEEYSKEIVKDDFDDFYENHSNNKSIPLHHDLLIEVDRLLLIKSYRTAYVIMYLAFEVATKDFIMKTFPQTEYLITEMQSPPLAKLYSEYINDIKKIIISNKKGDEFQILKKITNKRNMIVHQGKFDKPDELFGHYNQVKIWIDRLDSPVQD